MESLIARYFWGSTQEKKATHWICWEQACLPTEEGGLGIRRFEEMVEAFGMKLWVRFREQDSLWARYMAQKYCRNAAPSRVPFAKKQRMARGGNKIHKYIHWALGEGEIYFWEDIWWRDRAIRELCNPGTFLPLLRVRDFWVNGKWNGQMLRNMLIPLGVPAEVIEEIEGIPIDAGGKDILRWTRSSHGDFSTSSAWEFCRNRLPQRPIFKLIWNEHILPSISIFIWRLLANRIPVDAKLQWRKVSLASKCRCCRAPGVETREHLFLQSELAREVWEKVTIWFPTLPRWNAANTDLDSRIRFWQRRICQTERPHASVLIPCLVLWFIWSERNGCIHRNSGFTADSVFNRTKIFIQQLITAGKLCKEHWKGCDTMNMFNTTTWKERPRAQIKLVRWIPPDSHWIKLNTEGIWNSSEAGAGGTVRDEEGNIICGFMTRIIASSGLEASLQALSRGIDIARDHGTRIWIELNTREVVTLMTNNRFGAASLTHRVIEVRNKLKQMETKITHIVQQGNKAAIFLAKQGCKERNHHVFGQADAPPMLKALVRMDQLGLPNFTFA